MRLHLSLLLIFSVFSFSIHAADAELKMMPTMDIVDEASSKITSQEIMTFMGSEIVQQELIKKGVNPKEALERLASLSNEEMKSLASQIKKSQAGADFGVGEVLGLAIVVFLVLIITDMLGLTKVFSFTRSLRA